MQHRHQQKLLHKWEVKGSWKDFEQIHARKKKHSKFCVQWCGATHNKHAN